MSLLRSDRLPAAILLVAAAAGLAIAQSPLAGAVLGAKDAHVALGPFDLSYGHWVSDGLLAVFFFCVAVELRFELTEGALRRPRAALAPAIAATGGVLVPIALYLLVAGGPETASGWPIPTATDIAFALGVLAVVGRGMPAGVRVFLLALAILDDIVGIVLIAVVFTAGVDLGLLAAAAMAVAAFAGLSLLLGGQARVAVAVLMAVLAVAAWGLVYLSGVHATIAGVLLGLVMAPRPALRVRHALEPWVNGAILPLFAFSAALVVVPQVAPDALSPAFWGIALALPVGKVVGIVAFGALAGLLPGEGGARPISFPDLIAAGALGGIGFTVSLLLAELAFAGDAALRDEAVLGVLVGSGVSLVAAVAVVSWRAAAYRREGAEVVGS